MEKYEYPKPLKPEWITGEAKIDDTVVGWANSFGEYLTSKNDGTNDLSTSQIRRFFGEMKRIQSDFKKYQDEVPMIKAKLAYAVGRDYDNRKRRPKSKIQEFFDELERGLNAIQGKEKHFKNFVKLVEAIVAFHKFHGGKDN